MGMTMDVDFVPASGSPMVQADQRFNLAILKEDGEAENQLDAEHAHAAAIEALLQVEPDVLDVNGRRRLNLRQSARMPLPSRPSCRRNRISST